MTRLEFEGLPREKKCKYVWNRCTYLATRFQQEEHRRFRINLYYNGRFFVEVWYNSEYDYIGDIVSFKKISMLDPYVSEIDLKAFQL